jgi:UDP-N-acetylmuramoyl-tripeptide--D-alanyl-D-alanine ligase
MNGIRERQLWRSAMKLVKRDRPTIIAVGGGIAKTSTKVALGQALSTVFPGDIQVGFGNLNTMLGVPMSILGIEVDFHKQHLGLWGWLMILLQAKRNARTKRLPKYLILEYGTDQTGDIQKLVAMLKPNLAVVTLISPAHLEKYRDIDDMADDEAALAWSVEPTGTVFINAEDNLMKARIDRVQAKVIEVKTAKEDIAKNFARAVAKHLGADAERVEEALKGSLPTAQRFQSQQVGQYYLIDDSYNANPGSMEAALNLLKSRPGRKVAVLGTMREMGNDAVSYHRQVGSLAHQSADLVIGVGELTEHYQPSQQFPDSDQAAKKIFSYLREGDSILVKGSRGVRMEKIVEEIIKHGVR